MSEIEDTPYEVGGKKRKDAKNVKIKVTIHKDKNGRYLIIKNKRYRIGTKATSKHIAKFARDKVNSFGIKFTPKDNPKIKVIYQPNPENDQSQYAHPVQTRSLPKKQESTLASLLKTQTPANSTYKKTPAEIERDQIVSQYPYTRDLFDMSKKSLQTLLEVKDEERGILSDLSGLNKVELINYYITHKENKRVNKELKDIKKTIPPPSIPSKPKISKIPVYKGLPLKDLQEKALAISGDNNIPDTILLNKNNLNKFISDNTPVSTPSKVKPDSIGSIYSNWPKDKALLETFSIPKLVGINLYLGVPPLEVSRDDFNGPEDDEDFKEYLLALIQDKLYTGVISLDDAIANGATGHNDTSGGGEGAKGLSNNDIDKVMKKYPEYLGTYSHDQFPSILAKVKPLSRGCAIINTDPARKKGEHWQACFWDARPQGSQSIEWFDSYGDPIDSVLRDQLYKLSDKLKPTTYLKLKENRVRVQNDTSSNCGSFCLNFLMNRLRGGSFSEASGYDHSAEGKIKVFNKDHHLITGSSLTTGGGFEFMTPWASMTPSQRGNARSSWGPSIRRYLEPTAPETIISKIRVCRKPIASGVDKLLNIISLGGWARAKKEVGIDKALHLYMIITTKSGNEFRLEKNHVPVFSPKSGVEEGSEVKDVKIPPDNTANSLTFKTLLNNAEAKFGDSLQVYDSRDTNCQDFITKILDGSGLLTPELRSWINQDVKALFSKLPSFIGKVARVATDIATEGDRLINGRGYGNGKKMGKSLTKAQRIAQLTTKIDELHEENDQWNELLNETDENDPHYIEILDIMESVNEQIEGLEGKLRQINEESESQGSFIDEPQFGQSRTKQQRLDELYAKYNHILDQINIHEQVLEDQEVSGNDEVLLIRHIGALRRDLAVTQSVIEGIEGRGNNYADS